MVASFRTANWDTPLWISPNRRDSRYAASGGAITQYWSLHPLTPWAEHLRYHNVHDPLEAAELLVRPWVADVELPNGTIHVTFATATDFGIDPAALVDDHWGVCQAWAASANAPALIVPSAALPGTENLVMFGPKIRTRWGTQPADPEVHIPAEPVADLAVGLAELMRAVRWRGEPHPGYEAWRKGDPPPLPPFIRPPRR